MTVWLCYCCFLLGPNTLPPDAFPSLPRYYATLNISYSFSLELELKDGFVHLKNSAALPPFGFEVGCDLNSSSFWQKHLQRHPQIEVLFQWRNAWLGATFPTEDDENAFVPAATPLYEWFTAVTEGDLQRVKELLKAGHAVDQRDAFAWTGLMHAINQKNTELIKLLLHEGADPFYQHCNGTALIELLKRYPAAQDTILQSLDSQQRQLLLRELEN